MPASPQFQAPRGTRDILAPESGRWSDLVARFSEQVERAGYGLVISPLFEDVGVFERGMGGTTDVVSKEMYEFTDRGDRRMALRPEGTASIVRAFVQHRPPLVWKAWYVTPAFRYEAPQAGRLRQHHQLGLEAIGTEDADLDVEVVSLASGFYGSLGLSRVSLRLGSMGDGTCRPSYVAALRSYIEPRSAELCSEHRDRWSLNPLRLLDCKRPECRAVTEGAPSILEFLCDACAAHLARVRAGLEALGVAYVLDSRMVRGFDYYTRTTFEFAGDALEAAQNGIGGGGRYDGLVEALGGPPTPGIGFALGVERILASCDAEKVFVEGGHHPDVFVVDLTGGMHARDLTAELRGAGLRAARAYDDRSMKAQLKLADRSGAAVAAIVGPDEVGRGIVGLRPLRGEGDQRSVSRSLVVEAVREMLV